MPRITSHRIDQASYRRKLPPRPKDAYKYRLGTGRWIGYLKGTGGSESWCACWRDPAGVERQSVVGSLSEFPEFDDARKLVDKEIAEATRGAGSDASYTVEDACEDYIASQTELGGDESGKFARAILGPFVLAHPIARRRLRDLRHREVEEWRGSLATCRTPGQLTRIAAHKRHSSEWEARSRRGREPRAPSFRLRTPGSVNKIIRTLKAALNLAKARKIIASDDGWVDVKALKARDGQRDVYLDLSQRRRLLDACDADLRDLVLAALYTGARPNEVRDLLVEDFDPNTGTLRIAKRKGKVPTERVTYLTPDAVALFRSRAKGKLPKAPIFTKAGHTWQKQWWARSLRKAIARANAASATLAGCAGIGGMASDAASNKPSALPRGIVLYTMRHTAISEMLRQGIDIGRVGKSVGTSVKMIERHYQKFIHTDFVEKLAAIRMV